MESTGILWNKKEAERLCSTSLLGNLPMQFFQTTLRNERWGNGNS